MRLIDADALFETSDVFIVHTKEYGSIEVISVDAVGDAPTVDAVTVVRCGQCKFDNICCRNVGKDGKRTKDDFCSYGERMCEDAAD